MPIPTLTLKDASRVRQTYVNYWREITTVMGGRAVPLNTEAILVRQSDLPGSLIVETPKDRAALSIRGLTARRNDGSRENFDVYLQFCQTIQRSEEEPTALEAVRSNARMQYLEARSSEDVRRELSDDGLPPAKSYHGLHFDLRLPDEDFHPVYHMQYTQGCIDGRAIGRKYTCLAERADVPRIPTPPIDIGQLIYIVANDHLMNKGLARAVREEMLGKIRRAGRKLPRLPRHGFPGAVAHGHLECAWWYA